MTQVDRRQRHCAALLFAAVCGCVAAHADTPVALTNPGMEPPYNAVDLDNGAIYGRLAQGWSDNSAWASATVQYSEDTDNPHGGLASQKVVVTSVGTGRVQFIQQFGLQAGNIYTASVWLRATPGTAASLVIQQAGSPYATYIQNSNTLTADWQQLTATGYVATTEAAYLMIAIGTPGTLWVDDFALSYAPGTFAPTPRIGPIPASFFGMHVENFLQSQLLNSGFEPPYVSAGVNNPISGFTAANWYDNSSWGVPNPTVTYSEDDDNPHSGTASQKVSVQNVPPGDAVQLVQSITVIPGLVYTLSAWLRGDAGMKVNLILQDTNTPYAYFAYNSFTLTSVWQQFTISGTVNDTGSILLMFQTKQPGTFWVDDVQFTGASGAQVTGGVPWPTARFGTLRLWDSGTSWTSLEPEQGVWNWQPLDIWVAAAEQHGVRDILLTLGQTPPWASSNPDDVNY
ncbi:MAG: carbohydrate binding domain-containing protein, partial [Bryobacteraceae bacterium]